MGRAVQLVRRLLPLLTVVVAGAVLYDGWTFFSRWRDARRAEQAQQQKQVEAARKSVEMAGGGRFEILSFYAVPVTIRLGDRSTLCYGVSGAKQVRMEPPVADLHPAYTYCFQVAPRSDTEFTLIAESAAGATLRRSVRVRVIR